MHTALYARVSTERQERQQTIDGQLAALYAWAAAGGHAIVEEHVFRDEGYSGSRLDRPGLDALRDAACDGAVQQIAVLTPDRLARKYSGGSHVEIISYPGAVHQWDGGMPRRLIGRQLAGCRLRVERDGTVRDENTLVPMAGPFLRKVILGLCTSNWPYPIGRDDEVRARSDWDFGRFLGWVFGSPATPTR